MATGARTRHVAWRGWDADPDRLEAATVTLHADRLDALGTSRASDHVTSWSLTTGPGWVTRRLEVTARGTGWARHLDLVREDGGAWHARTDESGTVPGHLGQPGLESPDALDGALDCDIALCPVTQVYAARSPLDPGSGSAVVTYTSATRDFTADLTVDADGLVVDYPQLARRV